MSICVLVLPPWLSSAALSSYTFAKKPEQVSANLYDGLRLAAWEELQDDEDSEFILSGITHGFDIIDKEAVPKPVQCDNHKSAQPGSPLYEQATAQILKEVQMGNYEVFSEPPLIVSPMGIIPKPGGGVRLIHDFSLPRDSSVNNYCSSHWHQNFSQVDDAAALVMEGCYMAKVDLQSAY